MALWPMQAPCGDLRGVVRTAHDHCVPRVQHPLCGSGQRHRYRRAVGAVRQLQAQLVSARPRTPATRRATRCCARRSAGSGTRNRSGPSARRSPGHCSRRPPPGIRCRTVCTCCGTQRPTIRSDGGPCPGRSVRSGCFIRSGGTTCAAAFGADQCLARQADCRQLC